MKRKKKIHKDFLPIAEHLDDIIENFEFKGENFGNQDRNALKLFKIDNLTINVKSFRVPNVINQVVYKFFRKSKAQRSFEYACKLIDVGIKTPQPIGYFEYTAPIVFNKSYYLSEQLNCDLTFRELTQDFNYPEHEAILRAFTRFTYQLHEHDVLFLDHSPGNTLIKKTATGFDFYLVDLNRMEFRPLNFEERIKNFARLTTHKSMVEVMSDEYAKCIGKEYNEVYSLMWMYTEAFQSKYHRKRQLKNKLLFWRSPK
jgi:hypothetical protein